MQTPPQQSDDAEQTSPFCRQYEDAAQSPPLQCCEQHWVSWVHVFPSVRQVLFKEAHVPDEHDPLQHCVFPVHEPPSETHVGKAQTPPAH